MTIFRLVLGICLIIYVVVIKHDNDILREQNELLKQDNARMLTYIIEEVINHAS